MRAAYVLALFVLCGGVLAAQQAAAPSLTVDASAGARPVLRLDGLLADRELENAVKSGLPLRVRVRVELWKDELFDDLKGSQRWDGTLSYQPLEEHFLVRTVGSPPTERRLPTYAAARTVLETELVWSLRPSASGRYYYTANVEVETLSLSDFEELERWLRGGLKPAVSGDRSVAEAVGEGAKRLLMRALDLPARTLELRTERFRYSPER
jgi:hypothetical protein